MTNQYLPDKEFDFLKGTILINNSHRAYSLYILDFLVMAMRFVLIFISQKRRKISGIFFYKAVIFEAKFGNNKFELPVFTLAKFNSIPRFLRRSLLC